MRMLVGAVAMTALIGGASLACAATAAGAANAAEQNAGARAVNPADGVNPTRRATAAGRITAINVAKDSITLNNGSTFFAPPGAKLSNLRIGERVKIAYVRLGAVKDATRIAAGSNANPAGDG